MNFDTLYSLSQENKFTDLSLTICSDEDNIFNFSDNKITINVHKCVLYSSSTYFKNLFTLGSESNQDKIIIRVPNVFITCDIIASFYGQTINSTDYPDWLYKLEYIRCCDYIGVIFNTKNIRNILIPEKYFEFLINITEIANYDENIIECLAKNIPNNYDLSKLPDKIKDKLYKYNLLIISCNKNTINIHNVLNKSLISTYTMKGKNIIDMSYSSNLLATSNSNGTIKFFDIPSLVLIKTLKMKKIDFVYCKSICFSPDGLKLASKYSNGAIKIWDTTTWKLIREIKNPNSSLVGICFIDNNIIASFYKLGSKKEIHFIDIITGYQINNKKYISQYEIYEFKHNINNNQLFIETERSFVHFWYYNKNDYVYVDTKKYCKNTEQYNITNINLSPNGNYLVVTSNLGDIMVYCCKTHKYIFAMNNTDTCSIVNAYFYHNSMITVDCSGKIKIWCGETGETISEFNSGLTEIKKILLISHP
ncbi:BTB/POZ domain-containing protein [Megavirus baoshan]|uniref:BTB/POZ domain-containing protein n=1 Tax=Megavirus baoshan TaxID=2496520 RepID=A0A3Q8U8E5_9VIRU|nr:BTB/POZ domain-containing protein [Megavirus baoshan]AZL89678.1 BTB/POZ domain-containing protein [Megavirus baoshan]